ncbi:MAG: prepilin-type N-terminal cleavage/methylation domain-containing protein [Chlamydiae bacterium]|nr:prepilin-type N-terminal cleavage/methylation domain-containing protein [Chlamydiota bacterium]MBI3276965.1 prepilin-type N-terminal cleavage/methylation domain-containing protein [Chlamydiota bacterium]
MMNHKKFINLKSLGVSSRLTTHDSRRFGFTLIEIIVVIVLVVILVGFVSIPMGMVTRAYVTAQNLLKVHELGRVGIWRMEREFRELHKGNITEADISTLTFTDAYQESITYALSSGQLLRNGVLLVDHVTAFTLTYTSRTNTVLATPVTVLNLINIYCISIDLTVTLNEESYTFRDQIFPRDLFF